jgi:hypothetical protein
MQQRAAGSRWAVQAFADEAARARFAAEARVRLGGVDELNHDAEWLEAGCDAARGDTILTLAAIDDGKLSGLLPLRVAAGEIVYAAGGRVLLRKAVREHRMFGAPLTTAADPSAAMGEAMALLAREMQGSVVQVSAAPVGGAFYGLLSDSGSAVRRLFHVLPWGPENLHCKIDWAGTVEGYLASLGADSRRNLKRYSKKLFSAVELAPKIERFRSPDEVARFLDDGISVSDKTYQKRDLGLGLARGGALEKRMRFAAARGGFLGHILYLEGNPAAFHYGFVNGATFFVLAMGYDPAVARHQAGAVLWHGVLEDVERLKLPVKTIDCLPGVTDFKLRTTNRKETIRNFYLFKKSAGGTALYAALKTIDAAVEGAKKLAARRQKAGG